jgi:hypothetical protein
MPWVRFDDQFPIHRKVEGLSDAAFRLHISAIFWCARNLTDGLVPVEDIDSATPRKMRRPGKFIAELVGRGLWIEVDDGWQIHDYLDFQPSREKVERERKAKAERQQRWLEKRRQQGHRRGSTVDIDASGDASHDASKDDAPYPPRPEGGGGGDAPAASGAAGRAERKRPAVRAVPAWCGKCDERTRQIDPDAPRRCPNCHPLRDQETA